MTLTVSSTELFRNFRAYLAAVEAGQIVVITHYKRPRAVLAPAARLLDLLPLSPGLFYHAPAPDPKEQNS